MNAAKKHIRVRLVKSLIGRTEKQKACIRGLGLRRLGSQRELVDTPEVRGMINKIKFMLEVS